jgi:hypothetical protein
VTTAPDAGGTPVPSSPAPDSTVRSLRHGFLARAARRDGWR